MDQENVFWLLTITVLQTHMKNYVKNMKDTYNIDMLVWWIYAAFVFPFFPSLQVHSWQRRLLARAGAGSFGRLGLNLRLLRVKVETCKFSCCWKLPLYCCHTQMFFSLPWLIILDLESFICGFKWNKDNPDICSSQYGILTFLYDCVPDCNRHVWN